MHKPVWKLALIMYVASTFVLSFTAFAIAETGAAGKSGNVGTVMAADASLGDSGVAMEKDTETDATPAPTFADKYSLGVTLTPSVPTDNFTETAKQTKFTPMDHLDPKQVVIVPAPCHDFKTLTDIPPMPSAPEDTSTTEIPISPDDDVTPAPSSLTIEEEPIFPAIDELLDQTASDETDKISSSTDKTLTSMDESVDGAEPTPPTEDSKLEETPEVSLTENVTPAPTSPSSEPTVTTGEYLLEETPDLSLTDEVTPAPSSPLDKENSLDSVKAPCPPLPTAELSPTLDQPVDAAEPAPPAGENTLEKTPDLSLTENVTPAPTSPSSEPTVTTGDSLLEETPDLSLTDEVTPAPSSPLDIETSLDSVKAPCPPLPTAELSPTLDQPVDAAEPAPPAGENKLEETPELSLTENVTPAPTSPSSEPTVTTGEYLLEETPDLSLTDEVTPAPSSPLDIETSLDSVKAPCPPLPTAELSPTLDQPVDVAEPAPLAGENKLEETPELSLTENVTPAPTLPFSEPTVTTGDSLLEETPDLSLTDEVTPAPSSPLDDENSLECGKAPCSSKTSAELSPTLDQPVDVAEPAPPAGENKLEETPELSLTENVTPAPTSPSSEPIVTTGDYLLEETPDLSLTDEVTPAPSSPLDDENSLECGKAPCSSKTSAELSPTLDQPVDVAEPAPPAGEDKLEETPELSLTENVTPAPTSPSSEPTVTTGDFELEKTPDLSLTDDVNSASSSPIEGEVSLTDAKAPCPSLSIAGSFSSAPLSASSLDDEDNYNLSTAGKAPCPSLPKAPCPSLPQPADKTAKAPCPSLPQPQQGSGTGSKDQSVEHANKVKQMSLATSIQTGFAFMTVILSAIFMLL